MEQHTLQTQTRSGFRNLPNTHQPTIILIISMMLLGVFVYSATGALLDYAKAVEKMKRQVFPTYMSEYLTWTNILLQTTASALLINGVLKRRFLTAGLSLSIFTYSIYTLYGGLILMNVFHYTPCACINIFNTISWQQSVWLNIGILGLSVFALYLNYRYNTDAKSKEE